MTDMRPGHKLGDCRDGRDPELCAACERKRKVRIARLVNDRGLTQQAAEMVIDAVIFGKGCIPEKYR